MAPQSPRQSMFASCARRRSPAKSVRLRCEPFEDKITPAQFNVGTPMSFSGLSNNGCVVTADLNNDGFVDAVVTNQGLSFGNRTITVLYGRAGGGFNSAALDTGGTGVAFAAVADINGDGWPDVVSVERNGQSIGSVSVFYNNVPFGLQLMPGSPFTTAGTNSSWVGLADMTGDNVLDVIVASIGTSNAAGDQVSGNNITIFQGNANAQGGGNFTFSSVPITTLAPGSRFVPTALAVADFDGDGIMDIAAAVPGAPPDSNRPQPNGSVYVFKGTGSGGFAAPNQYASGGALPANIQAADVNGDGKKDLVVANAGDPNASPEFAGNSVGVILNASSGTGLSFGTTNVLNVNCYGTLGVAVADFDLDGKPDIAAINYGANTSLTPNAFVSLYLGDGTGKFSAGSPGTYDLGWNLPGGQALAVADFDRNGGPDLITVGAVNRVTVLSNTTAGRASVQSVTVNDGSAQRSMVRSVTVAFGGLIKFNGPAAQAFQLTGRQWPFPTGNVTVAMDLSGSTATQTIAKLTFSGPFTEGTGSLIDGRYTLTMLSDQIQGGLAGGDKVSKLQRLYGDVNGDNAVNGLDLTYFRNAFGTVSTDAGYVWYLDFNGDGAINGADLVQFRGQFGTWPP